jgi:hypothetical protein
MNQSESIFIQTTKVFNFPVRTLAKPTTTKPQSTTTQGAPTCGKSTFGIEFRSHGYHYAFSTHDKSGKTIGHHKSESQIRTRRATKTKLFMHDRGTSSGIASRIVNGEEAVIESFPWQVAIRKSVKI